MRGGFNIGIVVASVVAILVVRRSDMFPIVVAPPIVYSLASGIMLYLRSGGLHDKKVVLDAAANWLVYGFPAIAARHRRGTDHRRRPADHPQVAVRHWPVRPLRPATRGAAPAAARRSAAPRCG